MSMEDPETLLLLWAAPAGSDPSSPLVWRAASPHWTPNRLKMIAAKYKKALAGEQDKEFDDPDPMRGQVEVQRCFRIDRLHGFGDPHKGNLLRVPPGFNTGFGNIAFDNLQVLHNIRV